MLSIEENCSWGATILFVFMLKNSGWGSRICLLSVVKITGHLPRICLISVAKNTITGDRILFIYIIFFVEILSVFVGEILAPVLVFCSFLCSKIVAPVLRFCSFLCSKLSAFADTFCTFGCKNTMINHRIFTLSVAKILGRVPRILFIYIIFFVEILSVSAGKMG